MYRLFNYPKLSLLAVCGLATCVYYMIMNQHSVKVSVKNGVAVRQVGVDKYQKKMYDSTHPCSFQQLRELAVKYQQFPYGGEWDIMDNEWIGHWTSKICAFKISDDISGHRDDLVHYIKANHMSRITLLGDSNGARYNIAIIKYLETVLNVTCVERKRENFKTMKPDPMYFATNSSVSLEEIVIVHKRDCLSCKSTLNECRVGGLKTSIYVEYIAMDFILDNEITTYMSPTICERLMKKRCEYSVTYQEFIFKEYLKDNYPDILLVLMNNHDKLRKHEEKIGIDTTYFSDILDLYLPVHTKIIWFSGISEYNKNKPFKYRSSAPDHWITQVTTAFFKALLPRFLERDKQHYCFFDLSRMSLPILPLWSLDGVHLKPDWYNRIIQYMFHLLYATDK